MYIIQMMVTEVKSVWGKLAEDPHQANGRAPAQAASLPNGDPRARLSLSFIATFSILALTLVMFGSFVLSWQSLASLPATIRQVFVPIYPGAGGVNLYHHQES